MSQKVTTARYSAGGEKFEILVKPDPAFDFKQGKPVPLSEILVSDEIYSDASKGLRVSEEKLMKVFQTTDPLKVAEVILRKGELLITAEQRRRMLEEKRKQIISFIAKNYVDPKTNLPHPPTRIEQAMAQAKVAIDPFKDAEEQAKVVVEKLRSIIPLKTGNVKLKIRVPASFAPQSYGIIKSFGEILKQEWGADGGLTVILEIPIASQSALLDRLGSITKGAAQVTVME